MADVVNFTGKLCERIADLEDENDQLKNPTPPCGPPVGCEDVEAFFNMREWLWNALTDKGAKVDGAGIGCGEADVDIELNGHRYNVRIKPL